MASSSSHIAVQPGDGLVGRFGESVVLVVGPTSGVDPFVEDLVATVEAGSGQTALPGAALAHRIGELLFRAGSADVASFGVVAPVEDGVLVLLHGDVDAEISKSAGARRLSGRQAVTWVDHVVRGPFERLSLTGGSGPVSVHPRSDLRVGVVPGGGFVLTPGGGAPAPVVAPSATPAADDLPATEATEVAPAPVRDEFLSPVTGKRDSQAPFDQAADAGSGGAAIDEAPPVRGATIGAQSPFGSDDRPTGPPRRTPTIRVADTMPELVAEDGARTPLEGEYVLGREPATDEAVRSRQASPLQVDDPDQLVSRVHAHLRVDHGVVFIRDASSANGTFVAAPGAKDWTRVGQEGAELPLGWSIRVGGRVYTLEDAGSSSSSR